MPNGHPIVGGKKVEIEEIELNPHVRSMSRITMVPKEPLSNGDATITYPTGYSQWATIDFLGVRYGAYVGSLLKRGKTVHVPVDIGKVEAE